LRFSWDQATGVFSEIGSDVSLMASISANSSADCSDVSCILDFKIIFNENFATQGVNYSAQVYSTDDAARSDEDTYSNAYEGLIIWIDQIHYRWRNDDGSG
jgi:hypothetical protein